MVPFPPTNMQSSDLRQYYAESAFPAKTSEAFTSPPLQPFYRGCQGGGGGGGGGNRWDSGQPYLHQIRSEAFHGPQYSSYFSGVASLCPVAAHTRYVPRDEYYRLQNHSESDALVETPVYQNFVHPEIRLKHPGARSYVAAYESRCPLAATFQHIENYELASEAMARAPSPHSTVSGSDGNSIGFVPEEMRLLNQQQQQQQEQPDLQTQNQQLCNLLNAEPTTLSAYLSQQQYPDTTIKYGLPQIPSDGSEPKKVQTPNVKELERRRKNNEASRKSRAQKKDRFQMEMREVEYLKKENERLRNFLAELELVIQEANDTLIAKFKHQIPPPDQLNQF